MHRVTLIAIVAAIGCRGEEKKPPPPPPTDGIEITAPGAEPRRVLRYQIAPSATTPLELAMDVDLQTKDVAIEVPTLVLAIDLATTVVEPAAAKLKMTVIGASVKKRNDDPKGEPVVAIMNRQAALLAGLVITFSVAPNGVVSGSKIEGTGRDLSGPAQEQVQTLVQLSEQIAMPLPDQPIGVGAEWKHRRTIRQNQLVLTAITTVRVTAIDTTRVTFESTSDLTGADQTITQSGQSAQVVQIRGSGSQAGTIDLATAATHGEIRAALSFEMIAGNERRPTRFEIVTKLAPRTAPAPDDAGSAGPDDAGAGSGSASP